MQQKYPYKKLQVASLERTVSLTRLSTYQKFSTKNTVDALRLYHWNMAVGQSLYIPLQTLEVSLRNTVCDAIKQIFGQNWYLQPRFKTTLTGWAKKTLEKTIKKANRENRKKRKTTTEGDVISNLTFSFWGELLAARYDQHLWDKQLFTAFPHLPKVSNSQYIYYPVHEIIKLRNRISHHEPIFRQKLEFLYNSMLDVTGWICLDTKDWVEHHCDFEIIYQNKPKI